MGLNFANKGNRPLGLVLSALLVAAAVVAAIPTMITPAYAARSASLTVNGLSLDGKTMSMWVVIQHNGSTVKSGFTPLVFSGSFGNTYTALASDYLAGNIYFDHWEDKSTSKSRTITLNGDTSITAYYRTGSSSSSTTTTTTTTSPTTYNLSVNALLSSTGNSLGMYTTIRSAATGTTVKTGFTPISYTGTAGAAYTVSVSNYGSYAFDHWSDGSTANPRTVTLNSNVSLTASFKDTSTTSSTTTTVKIIHNRNRR